MPREIKSNLIEDDTVKLLNKFKILKELTLNEIRLLLGTRENDYQKRIAKLVKYQAEETVIREGDFDSWIFWIVKGEFAVIKNDVVVAVFNAPGEVFGEMSIMDEDSRSASVVTVTKGICLSIDMSILDSISNEFIKTKIKTGINHLKSERLNQTTAKLVKQKQKVVEEKQKLVEQQKEILVERLRLIEKEEQLNKWEEELKLREFKLKNK